MAIGMAQQKGTMVYVYDEDGRILWTRGGELQGWTSNIVTIKNCHMLYMMDEKGSVKSTRGC